MKMTRRSALALAAGTLAVAAGSVGIAAPVKAPAVAGTYQGTSLSSTMGSTEVAVDLTVTAGRNRRITALLNLTGADPAVQYALVGTLSASGGLSLRGKQPRGAVLILNGKFTDSVPNEDPMQPPAPREIRGTYQFTRGGDRGTFVVTAAP